MRKGTESKSNRRIVGTRLDNNKLFDIKKLMALDRQEFNRLNELYGEYRRYHGPILSREIWNEALELIAKYIPKFNLEKYGDKPFGWINTIIQNEVHRAVKEQKEASKLTSIDELAELDFKAQTHQFIDESQDLDNIIEKEETQAELLDRLIKQHFKKKEYNIYQLYISGALISEKERAVLTQIKNKIRSIVWTKEELIELKKKKKFVQQDKKSKIAASKREFYVELRKLSKEEREKVLTEIRNKKREEKLAKLSETNPYLLKQYKKRLNKYDEMNSPEKKKIYAERQLKYKEERKKEKIQLREEIKKQQKKDNE